jgi:phosphohistidine phosphatase SixA
MLQLLTTLSFAANLLTASVTPPELRGEALMVALRNGGYTIVLRHARTDRSYREEIGTVPASRAQQRNLNDDGVRDARLMGVVFRKYAIPFGDVLASPMFRTMETAEYAVGPAAPTMVLRAFPSADDARKLISVAPKSGTNRLLVTHHFIIETHVPGIKPGDVGESEAAVVRPSADGGIELVGRILLADWQALAADAASTNGAAPQGHGAPGANVPAAYPSAPVVFPQTTLGHLAQAYVQAFSSGDTATMRRFIESSLEVDANRPVADRLTRYAELFADNGPLHITAIETTVEREITVVAQAKRGGVRLTVKESGQQKGRAASVTLRFEGQ